MPEDRQIARLNIAARLEYLPAVMGFVQQIALRQGLSPEDTGRLELITEEACINVIEHAFDPDEEGQYDVIISRRPGQVVIAVEDRGLPLDFKKMEREEEMGLGTALMKAFADEINFINLGRQGKRVELVKNLPQKEIQEFAAGGDKSGHAGFAPVPADTPVSLRLLKPGEAAALARLIYHSYGYSYMDTIYHPEQVDEMLEAGLITSFAAFTADGELVGHAAITRDEAGARMADYGKAVVDPRYRAFGLLTKLSVNAIDYARQAGMYGLYCEATAVHPYSQRAAVALGWHEMGVLLGFAPAGMYFKHIQQRQDEGRTSVVIYCSILNQPPARPVYPPPHHQAIIKRIYRNLQLNRTFEPGATAAAISARPSHSRVNVRTYAGESWAFMAVAEYGADLVSQVEYRLRELRTRHIDCIYIDLPLSDPATPQYCASLEMLGFFFGAIIPEHAGGDILRLQYLNNVDVRVGEIVTASEFGRELLDYVLRGRENA